MRRSTASAALLALVPLAGDRAARAAGPEFRPLTLATGDGVELAARYTPGRLGGKSPAVIVLDDVRSGGRPEVGRAVAGELASAGCAVLTFDFRGHGGSTAVTPDFWADPTNRRLVRRYHRARPKDRIAFADFRPGYLPALVNDVAAARAFLDRRNDAGECNTGQLYVVGFGGGATLGALWVAAEWQRFRCVGTYGERLDPAPEGRDVAGCVWVDPAPALDKRAVSLGEVVRQAGRKGEALFGLVHAAGDDAGAGLAADLFRRPADGGAGRRVVAARAVPGDGPLAGRPGTVAAVAGLIADMREVQEVPLWEDRDFVRNRYVWARPGSGVTLAKAEGEEVFRPVPAGLLPIGR
jgi:dienelactone hydrolase